MQVIIMRGLPGSGKSTYAKKYQLNYPKVIIHSADTYHTVSGKYVFNPENIPFAHNNCLQNFLYSLQDKDIETIIVDNTNTTAWEIAPYYRLAEVYGCDVKILRIECSFETSIARNIHNVPHSKIWGMYQNMQTEKLPSHWKEEFMFSEALP